MTCEKCKAGEMQSTRIPRFSAGLTVIGYVLAFLALVGALATAGYLYRSGPAGAPPTTTTDRARANAATALRQVEGVTPELAADFEDDGVISETQLSNLTDDARGEVDKILTDYKSTIAATGSGGQSAAGRGGQLVWGVYLLCAVLFVVGIRWTLKKDAWRCSNCGLVADDVFYTLGRKPRPGNNKS